MRARLPFLAGYLALLVACDDALPSVPVSDAALTYIVLAKDSVLAADSVVSGLIATAGTPAEATYRHIEELTMRRTRDGAIFQWQIRDLTAQPISTPTINPAVPIPGNAALARVSTPGQLGRDSLEHGERYSFHIVTEGRVIEAEVQIPGQPKPIRLIRGTQEVVAWPRVPGAGGYIIHVDTDRTPQISLADTQYTLRRDRPSGEVPASPRAVVRALDVNLARILTDTSARSAGVRGSYGVIGAMSAGAVSLATAAP